MIPCRESGKGTQRKPLSFKRGSKGPDAETRITSCPWARNSLARERRKLYRYQSVLANRMIFAMKKFLTTCFKPLARPKADRATGGLSRRDYTFVLPAGGRFAP